MRRVRRPLNALLGLFVAAAVVCTPRSAAALSLEDEKDLGREFLVDVKKAFVFVEDEYAIDYINRLGEHLQRAVETKPFPFSFYLIQRNSLNAFAGPGGHIFFFTGLIENADTVDELAAVACHEMGHITARHISHRIEQNKKISMATMAGILAGILIGGKAMGAVTAGSMAAGAQAQLAFSRADERQADQLGFSYMRESGFDPSAMIRVLKTMQGAQVYGTDKVPAYLRTHPTGAERMTNMDSLLSGQESAPKTETSERLREEYPVFRTLLAALYGDPKISRRRFEKELREDPEAALALFGLGLMDKGSSDFARAVDHLGRALELRPDMLPARIHLGEAYQYTGRYEEAIPLLEGVLEEDANNRDALYLLATSHQNLESYARAARIYERLLEMEPVRDDVSYNLGLCYGRMDRLALAHYHFGVFFKRTGRPDQARFHFEKADELARHDMDLRRRIQKARENNPDL